MRNGTVCGSRLAQRPDDELADRELNVISRLLFLLLAAPRLVVDRRIPFRRSRLSTAVLAVLLAVPTAWGQAPANRSTIPTGVAELAVEGRWTSTVNFSLLADGPRFSLEPIAELLDVDLRVGPLEDSYVLITGSRSVTIGPERSLMVVVDSAKDTKEMVQLGGASHKTEEFGLQVTLEFLDRALGEPLGFQFTWSSLDLRLRIGPRQVRQVDAAITVVHQYQITTVEIELSEKPRYRLTRAPGLLEVQFAGDQLNIASQRGPAEDDPLVTGVVAGSDRLRIELGPDAEASEPRLLAGPPSRLIVEIFRQSRGGAEFQLPTSSTSTKRPGVRTIVIDPGHGGSETGAVSATGTAESELTMLLAESLKTRLEARLPVRVVLTRTGDQNVELETRTAIANQNGADLFISLHLNSSFGHRAHGAETYFLSREASDQRAAERAEAENQSDAGPSPEMDLQLILWDLAQSFHLAESQRFAKIVQQELNVTLGLRDRGVKQAPFRVLFGAAMPAVLVELGFLSNPEEEKQLQTATYRAELVEALVRAVVRYRNQVQARADADRRSGSSGGGQ